MHLLNNLSRNNYPKKKSFNSLIILPALLLVIILSVILYSTPDITDTDRYRSSLLTSAMKSYDFSNYINDLFKYEVTSDSVTTAYTLRNPKAYNIPDLTPRLADFSSKDYAKDSKKGTSQKNISKLSDKLASFNTDNLTITDHIIYDILTRHLKLSEELCSYPYYETLLGKTTGAAANLPVTLSEYPLNSAEDVETYLSLLKQIPDYFDSVIEYEKKRIDIGMPTPTFILKDTEKELSTFIKSLDNDSCCFITAFDKRVSKIPDISSDKKNKYISNNKYYVNQYILPAYRKLYDYISGKINDTAANKNSSQKSNSSTNDISVNNHNSNDDKNSPDSNYNSLPRSQSKNSQDLPNINKAYGLSSYAGGKEYYELLVKSCTGSYRPVSELIEMTESELNNALSQVMHITVTDMDAYMYYCDHPVETGFHSPEGILEALSLMIREDYPVLENIPDHSVKTVPEALSQMTSPAFYMIPAIDDYKNNTIYINPLYTSEENGSLFTTLAHEGFPGHLYQTVYFNATNPSPIRQILNYPGYVEGWATYAELNSFSFIDYPKYQESLPILYRCDTIISLALSSRIDMGVNYENWTLNDTCRFFEDLGFNSYYASDIYSYVVEAPGNYLSYFIGYLEINELKNEYRNLKMENYNEKDFHKAILDIGPADFETIRKYILMP